MRMLVSGSYQAYLLRLWRETPASPWRASVEDPHTGTRQQFANIAELMAFLQTQTPPPPTPTEME